MFVPCGNIYGFESGSYERATRSTLVVLSVQSRDVSLSVSRKLDLNTGHDLRKPKLDIAREGGEENFPIVTGGVTLTCEDTSNRIVERSVGVDST